MAEARVSVVLAGDSQSLDKAFNNVGSSAKSMASDLDKAEADAKGFGSAMDKAGAAADGSTTHFRGSADALDGLGGVLGSMGIPLGDNLGMVASLGSSFADLADGLATTVIPAIKSGLGGALTFIAAHPVIFAIGLIIAAVILLYTQSETFREIVSDAFEIAGNAVESFKNVIVGAYDWVKNNWSNLLGILTKPFDLAVGIITKAFDTIVSTFKSVWNTVADFFNGLDFTIDVPDFLPGIPSKVTIGTPDLPRFHRGGIVPGTPGSEVPIMAMAGETVTPSGQNGGTTVIQLVVDGRVLTEIVHSGLLRKQRGTPLGFAT